MPVPFLLARVLLRFATGAADLRRQLSAAVRTPDGGLWLGSDELATLQRLSPVEPFIYGDQTSFRVGDYLPLPDPERELDVEGMSYSDHYLWFTGSHSTRRKQPKGKKLQKDVQRLADIDPEPNRYVLGRLPLAGGAVHRTCAHPDDATRRLTAGALRRAEGDRVNALTEALRDDPHLGAAVRYDAPTKENGFDVEGLAVRDDRIFLGLRGPVLGGWAIILDFSVEADGSGALTLAAGGGGGGRPYRKHFLDLDGLGIRELSFAGDDLIVLAGPTMKLEGAMKLFRLRGLLERTTDSVVDQEAKALRPLFGLPFTSGADHAEGITPYPCFGRSDTYLFVYDSPAEARLVGSDAVFADVFALTAST